MAKCSGITQAGRACKGIPIDGSQWCYVHHPDHVGERRRHGAKGGKRGGRGRPSGPSVDLARLQRVFEGLAEQVLKGDVERGVAAVAAQCLNGARACIRDALAARQQEELTERIEHLEAALERKRANGGTDGEPRAPRSAA